MSITVQPAEAKNGSKYYGKLSDALSSSSEGTIEVLSSANATGTLKDNVTLKDLVGNTFTAAEGDAEVTVKSGVLTGLNSGKGDYSGSGSVTVDGKSVGTASGKTVTLDADGKTATPEEAGQDVTIDGVTFNSPTDTPAYSLDDPYSALEEGGTAKVGADKKLKTDGDNANLTVIGEAVVTKSAPGEDGTGTVGQAKVESGKTAKVGENSYKGTGNTVLDLVKDGEGAGHVELAEGSVTLPAGSEGKNNSVTVNGKVVENTGNSDITVEKEADGKIKVTVPGSTGGKVVVDGREYEIPKGPTVLTVDPTGEANVYTLESGDVKVDPEEDVHVKVGDEDVKVENLGEGEGKERTVEAGKPEEGSATVTVPSGGGKMQAGDDVYSNGGTAPVQVELRPDGSKAVTEGDVTLESGEIVLPDSEEASGAKVTLPREGDKNVTVENAGDGDLVITDDWPDTGSSKVEIPAGGKAKFGEGNEVEGPATVVVDKEGEVKKVLYLVDGTDVCTSAEDALGKMTDGAAHKIEVVGTPDSEEKWENVAGLKTFVDYYGRTYTVPEGSTAELTVETDGTITVENGTVTFDPTTRGDDNGHAMPEGMDGKSVKVKDGNGEEHTVIPEGPVTFNIDSESNTGTVTPENADEKVDIDGVVFEGCGETGYDLDKPFDGLKDGGTATVPGGSAKEVVVSGTEPDGKFTVKTDAGNSGETVITKGGDKENVAGQVEVPAGDTVTVNGNEYKAKAGEDGGATLDLVKDAEKGDHAELVEGEITLPGKGAGPETSGNSVCVAGKEVTNPNTDKDITVKADKEKGTGTVTVPGKGNSVKIGENTYTNAGEDELVIEVGPKGNTLTDGTLTLPGNAAEELPDAAINVKSGDEYVSVTNKGETDSNITVNGYDEAADGKPSVTVPGGGAVDIGGTEYTVPAGETPTKFVIGEDGKPDITSGAVELDDNESVGFSSVEIGNDKAATEEKKPVKVEVQEDGKAKVTVPAGETLTVTGADGETHTYKNNGPDELAFTVDEDGNVTVESIPEGGIVLGEDSTITISPDNTLTAGADGATLKPTTDETNPNDPPLLDKGSVIFPDKESGKGTVMVNDPTSTENKEKKIEGNDVEAFAGKEGNPVKPVEAKELSDDAKFKVQGGTEYIIPNGETAQMKSGTFDAPAKGEINDNKDGPKDGNYVLVPDKENNTDGKKLWTDKSADPDSNDTHVLGDKGAAFDVKEKSEPNGSKENLKSPGLGHYEVTEQDSHFTVDNGDDDSESGGTVTLTDGGLKMTKDAGGNDPSVTVAGITEPNGKVTGDGVTVTTTKDDDGNFTGADVEVPANGKVKIGETEYEAGEKGLTLHVDKDGGVSLKDGAVKLDDGESIPFGDIVFENPTGSGDDQVTVTAPMKEEDAGYTPGSAKVVDRNGDEVEYTDNADGTITFKMPRSNVEVVAEFEHFCPSLEFPDLDVTQWYHEATDYVIWFDVMNGHDTGLFAPEGYATRAEMVTVLWNQVGREEVDFDLGYTDVEAGEWYYEAIQWATSVGVINGYADGSFRPNQAISREEMAAMLYRFEQELGQGGVGSDGELKFADAGDVSDWAFDEVLWCAKKEIILGEDGNYSDIEITPIKAQQML